MSKTLIVGGHGAGDPGAVGGGHNERDAMRLLAKEIKALIPSYVDVYDTNLNMFRETNKGKGIYITPYQNIIELHMDASSKTSVRGGHVIIHKNFKPDALDLKLAKAIKERVGWSRKDGFDYRNNLLNLNICAKKGISYRLLELGFISNAQDRASIITEVKETARVIAEAITGKSLDKSAPSKKEETEVVQLLNETGRAEIRSLLKEARNATYLVNGKEEPIINPRVHTDDAIAKYDDVKLLSYQAAVISRTFNQ
ncbi:N-acetylmuramoyl-L-alanine amidase [Lysinibacillus sp. KU-BSD001]|uniref:N-acetylmuramoyl-L-alanine amidase n=1 Tax=Lysinibacillus sp. KU-BSD001 TaxID=3141328 RepID=UPI0036E781AE